MMPAVDRSAASALAGESETGASHIPPAMVKSTKLDNRGLVSDSRSDAVVEMATARVLTRPPVGQRSAASPSRRALAAMRDKLPNKRPLGPPAVRPQATSELSS